MISKKKIFSIAAASGLVGGLMLLTGCGDNDYKSYEDRQHEKQEQILESIRSKGIEIGKINLPAEFSQLSQGSYEVTITSENGTRDCIANVIKTTHGRTNITLNCD